MARLSSAACPNCAASVRVEPGREQARCDFCGHHVFVHRPVMAPPRRAVAEPTARPILVVVSVSMLITLGVGVGLWRVIAARAERVVPAYGLGTHAATGPGAAPADHFFVDASPIATRLASRLGAEVSALQVVIYDEYAMVQARDPQQPEHVDEYMLREGGVRAPSPVGLPKDKQAHLEKALFPLASLRWDVVPKLVEDAVRRAEIQDAKVTHIIVERGIGGGEGVGYRVYLRGARDGARFAYDEDGKPRGR